MKEDIQIVILGTWGNGFQKQCIDNYDKTNMYYRAINKTGPISFISQLRPISKTSLSLNHYLSRNLDCKYPFVDWIQYVLSKNFIKFTSDPWEGGDYLCCTSIISLHVTKK